MYYNWGKICEITDPYALRAIFADTTEKGRAQVAATLPEMMVSQREDEPVPTHPWSGKKEEVIAVLTSAVVGSGVLTICAQMNCPCVRRIAEIPHDVSSTGLIGEAYDRGLPGWAEWTIVGVGGSMTKEERDRNKADVGFFSEVLLMVPTVVFE